MKLLNYTKIPDAVLEPLLLRAGRAIGVRTTGVVVKVNPAYRSTIVSGTAYHCGWVRWRRGTDRRLATDGGAFKVTLPVRTRTERPYVKEWRDKHYDPLEVAAKFFWVARHEWGHIRDYQSRYWQTWSSRGQSGRRPRHDSRPEEIRAFNYADEADDKDRGERWAQEEILNLAIALEQDNEVAVIR
jgi:hypothetical protein